ncbi:unnamed protein product [Mycena citricolor]|uniref:Uncharacterized protein n=1 Tax=Mycena citricolor TaxID=2018698 RepID=A0AAD2JV01_9AGAR|nr:unnamed protein product [Mycena citricolor]
MHGRRDGGHTELLQDPHRSCRSLQAGPSRSYEGLRLAEPVYKCGELSHGAQSSSCQRACRKTEIFQCAAAIRWSGFREYIYGTSIETLIRQGWGQIRISSAEIFRICPQRPPAPADHMLN